MNASIQTKCDELVAAIRADVMASVLAKLTGEDKIAPKQKANGHAVRRKGEKRDPKDIARTVERLSDAIKANAGERIEQVAQRMGISTSELKLPVKKLLAAKRIRTVGHKRARRYYPRSS